MQVRGRACVRFGGSVGVSRWMGGALKTSSQLHDWVGRTTRNKQNEYEGANNRGTDIS
jgi:hypothetical protein